MCNRLVAYYRVSTKAQQNSGLGLDAQSNAVAAYASANSKEIIALARRHGYGSGGGKGGKGGDGIILIYY